MTLESITKNVSYILGSVNIGVISNGKDAVIIDSGIDKDSGRTIKRTLDSEGLILRAIINTHSHADHFGGNDYLVRNLGVNVYAPPIESGVIENPILEPIYLFHGAYPIQELQNKFVYAKPSPVNYLLETGVMSIIGKDIEVVSLKGHSFNQIGVLADDVLFCADTVFPESVLKKYGVPVVQDVGSNINTLKKLRKTSHRLYVPSHANPTENVDNLLDINEETTNHITDEIIDILDQPMTATQIESELCTRYGLNIEAVQQYYLVHTTVMAYLGYLHEAKKIEIIFNENSLLWKLARTQK